MTDTLFPVDETPQLTPRQQLAFDYLQANDGVAADEVGAYLHAHRDRRPHPVGERCDWCAKDGLSVLRSKALAPLVTYRRSREGRLYLPRDKPAAATREPRSGVIAVSQVLAPDDPFFGL